MNKKDSFVELILLSVVVKLLILHILSIGNLNPALFRPTQRPVCSRYNPYLLNFLNYCYVWFLVKA